MEQRYTQQAYDDLLRARDEAKLRHEKALLALGEAAEADSNTWHDNPAFDAANEAIRHAQNNLREIEHRLRDANILMLQQTAMAEKRQA